MISTIEISGIGVIDRATLDFGEGLTVLTGETGAGKTMVLTSVNLLMGSRAEPALVREGRSRAQVDGVFTLDEQQIAPLVEEGIDVEDSELIVSRTVLAQGRSRAHVGGRMVPASALAQTVAPLITVHGQAEQLRLKNPNAQRDLVDSYGDQAHQDLLAEYGKAWKEAVNAKRSFDDITKNADERIRETESLSAALEAIDAFDPHEGEDEELRLEAWKTSVGLLILQRLSSEELTIQMEPRAFFDKVAIKFLPRAVSTSRSRLLNDRQNRSQSMLRLWGMT